MTDVTHWLVPPDHPALAGHFPGAPMLPGAVLLDVAIQAIANASGISLDNCVINSVKFLYPAGPGDELSIQHMAAPGGTVRFDIMAGKRKIASGSITPRLPA